MKCSMYMTGRQREMVSAAPRVKALREIIDLFVDPSFKKRMIYLWEKPKRRAQLLDELLHCAGYFREACSIHLDPPLEDPTVVAQRIA